MNTIKTKMHRLPGLYVRMLAEHKLMLCCAMLILISACNSRTPRNNPTKEEVVDLINTADTSSLEHAGENEYKIDTLSIIAEVKDTVRKLKKTKDPQLVDDDVFGDCIIDYLLKEWGEEVTKKDVLDNINILFDKDFMRILNGDKIIENISFFTDEDERGPQWIEIYTGQEIKYLYIDVSIPPSDEFEHSSFYWFLKKDDQWLFCGLTCAG